jgi:hypothetical protein
LAGPANKRFSLKVLIAPRGFADEHQLRRRIPYTEDDMRSASMKPALRTLLRYRFELC